MINVSVYTRHNLECDRRADKNWRKCRCPKWLYWAYQGKRYRVSAKTNFWASAEDVARRKEQTLRDIELGKPAPAEQGMTLADSVDRYLAHKRSERLAEPTLYKHKHVLKTQMTTWCERNGIHFLAHFTRDKLQQWRNTWEESPITARNKQERVRGFFRFVMGNGWLTMNPAFALSRIKVPKREPSYFTASELEKILDATVHYGKSSTDRKRMRAAVLLMRWSGLAIRDTVCLERSRLDEDNRLLLSRAKNSQPVYIELPKEVAEELRNVPAGLHGNPRYFFWSGVGLPKTAVSDWERAFRRLFKLAKLHSGVSDIKRCHPHMFRHTFSIHLLDAGVPIETVSALLGHESIRTTEKHYKAHTKITQQRISQELRKAWKVMGERKD